MSYQRADRGFIDYHPFSFGALGQEFRDRRPLSPQPLAACIGAAQTFGRYVPKPFPALLEERLGGTVLNFGTGGAGPEYFANDGDVLSACNLAKLVIVQVMSARSVSNRFFTVRRLRNARIDSISPELRALAPKSDLERFSFAHDLLGFLARREPDAYARILPALKETWLRFYSDLLGRLTPPKLLFWFSQRRPDEEIVDFRNDAKTFPHFVDRAMVDTLAGSVAAVVECVSSAGLPQSLLVDGATVLFKPDGGPRAENVYYPSPEMHTAAAAALAGPVEALLAKGAR